MIRSTLTPDPRSPAPKAQKSRDFAQLARRISSWTANLLVTLVLVVAALTVGSEVTSWWRADDVAESAPNSRPTPARPALQLAVGPERHPLALEHVTGAREDAVAALVEQARNALKSEPRASPPPLDAAEVQLLEQVRSLKPVAQSEQGEVYELAGGLPLVVAVRGEQSQRRVVYCGLALATEATEWALYGVPRLQTPDYRQISLPPGGEVILSLQDAADTTTLIIAGPASPADWISFYRAWALDNGWTAWRDWQHTSAAWAAVYVQPATGQRFDVQLVQAGPDVLRGVLVWSKSSPLAP